MYQTANSLASVLPGVTCFLSRYHVPKNRFYAKVQTLHSLVFEILNSTEMFDDRGKLKELLGGSDTLDYVEEALSRLPSLNVHRSLFDYYYRLREHQNSGRVIEELPEGRIFLEFYQNIKEGKMDWEESMQLATWYLKQKRVSYIKGFQYQSIVLLNPESLNKKSREFWEALVNWQQEIGDSNILMISNNATIGVYQDEEYKLIKLSEVCHQQASFLWNKTSKEEVL